MKNLFIIRNSKGATNMVEVMVAGLIFALSFLSYNQLKKNDKTNFNGIEKKWHAQIVADSVTNIITTMSASQLLISMEKDKGKKDKDNVDYFKFDKDTLKKDPQLWNNKWKAKSSKIAALMYKISFHDKDGSINPECEKADILPRCHKKISIVVQYDPISSKCKGVLVTEKRFIEENCGLVYEKWEKGIEFPIDPLIAIKGTPALPTPTIKVVVTAEAVVPPPPPIINAKTGLEATPDPSSVAVDNTKIILPKGKFPKATPTPLSTR